jgi:DNA-binding LytR/AlgR family response regulator
MSLPEPTGRAAPTAVLAEDEPLLADELAELLHTLWPQLQIVARASDGVEALHAIEAHAPDVALLDIHMPLLDGLEVARRIDRRCQVVFITSYDQHAVAAFEAGAIDYVLKPPRADRLLTTLQRVKERLRQPRAELSPQLLAVPPPASGSRRYLQWINASRGSTVR